MKKGLSRLFQKARIPMTAPLAAPHRERNPETSKVQEGNQGGDRFYWRNPSEELRRLPLYEGFLIRQSEPFWDKYKGDAKTDFVRPLFSYSFFFYLPLVDPLYAASLCQNLSRCLFVLNIGQGARFIIVGNRL